MIQETLYIEKKDSFFHSNQDCEKEAKANLDSHAGTTVAGSTCRVLEFTEKLYNIFPLLKTITYDENPSC